MRLDLAVIEILLLGHGLFYGSFVATERHLLRPRIRSSVGHWPANRDACAGGALVESPSERSSSLAY